MNFIYHIIYEETILIVVKIRVNKSERDKNTLYLLGKVHLYCIVVSVCIPMYYVYFESPFKWRKNAIFKPFMIKVNCQTNTIYVHLKPCFLILIVVKLG